MASIPSFQTGQATRHQTWCRASLASFPMSVKGHGYLLAARPCRFGALPDPPGTSPSAWDAGVADPVPPLDAEVGDPLWGLDQSTDYPVLRGV